MAFQLLGAFVLVSIAVPVVLPVFIPLALIYRHVQGRYVVASREIKRWEAITRSPVSNNSSVLMALGAIARVHKSPAQKWAKFLATKIERGSWEWGGERGQALGGNHSLAGK